MSSLHSMSDFLFLPPSMAGMDFCCCCPARTPELRWTEEAEVEEVKVLLWVTSDNRIPPLLAGAILEEGRRRRRTRKG